mgnify:CR=1 FL=1
MKGLKGNVKIGLDEATERDLSAFILATNTLIYGRVLRRTNI